jgi:hypothetical protein
MTGFMREKGVLWWWCGVLREKRKHKILFLALVEMKKRFSSKKK